MKVDKNGVVIDSITNVAKSVVSDKYIVMWDNDGIPIHIDKNVVEYMHNFITQMNTQPSSNLNDAFL